MPPGSWSSVRCCCWTQNSLGNLLLFGRLDRAAQSKIVDHTWERTVAAGEILIQEGEVGLAATELYIVKSGKFEVRWALGSSEIQRGTQHVTYLWRGLNLRVWCHTPMLHQVQNALVTCPIFAHIVVYRNSI